MFPNNLKFIFNKVNQFHIQIVFLTLSLHYLTLNYYYLRTFINIIIKYFYRETRTIEIKVYELGIN